ncbi:TlpA family protein disulfide reductase [Sediminibacillus albus]|uniref:Thiol-disulfide isomerase or thioredoxin n=1 Tax=Sediminibacillus albus TaxID=407036 RepID=A0A1G8YWM5_9BACI|nr:TlpA disulfide reductase family protein [Sediminibacillus albus]SDK07176.1 Thiol-disulfide isomerase or thioredoxin [Sediminibacillus albus]
MKAPLFELPLLGEDQIYNIEKDLGKVIVITFWVSWCPDCAVDLPKKEQLYKTINNDKVKLITINVTGRERNLDAGLDYKNKFLQQPTLADEGRSVYDLYHCNGVPSTIVIDQQGRIAGHFGDKAPFLTIVDKIGSLLG